METKVSKHQVNSRNGNGSIQEAHRLIAGGICVDKPHGVEVVIPRSKIPIRSVGRPTGGGGSHNVSIGHRKLAPSKRVLLLANVGDDADGRHLQEEMASYRVEMPITPLVDVPTSFSIVLNEVSSGASTIASFGGAREVPIPLEQVEGYMPGAESCCVVAHAVNEQIPDILRIAARNGVPVYLGLGGKQVFGMSYEQLRDSLIEEVEMAICNLSEASHLAKRSEVVDLLKALQFEGRVRTAIITGGAKGIYARQEKRLYHAPAYTDPARPIADDTGAGDATQATIIDSLLQGLPLEIALLAGARQGFEACTAVGATTHLLDAAAMQEYLLSGAGVAVR